MTTIKLYECYAVKIYKNKQSFKRGPTPGVPVLDPPLTMTHPKSQSTFQTITRSLIFGFILTVTGTME